MLPVQSELEKRMRVALPLGDVAGSIVIGSVMVHFGEGLDWIDSFYLSDVSLSHTSIAEGEDPAR
jgi:hypothetical protein